MDLLNGMNLPAPVSTKLFEVILTGSMYLRLSVVLSSSVKMGSGEGLRENTSSEALSIHTSGERHISAPYPIKHGLICINNTQHAWNSAEIEFR